MRVVLASGNQGKLRELAELLAPLDIELVAQRDLGIESPEETGHTFVENALLKARHAAAESGLPAIADDSGLVVAALDGAPGIRSARFAGEDASDADNNRKLLAALADAPGPRDALFYSAVVFLASIDDPAPIIATAAWTGRILDEPRGHDGFGYDPFFLVPELGKTAAELPSQQKNALSHRGKATRMLIEALRVKL